MYLHLGKGTVVPKKDVVGIFDLDITSQSHQLIKTQFSHISRAVYSV